MSKPISLFSGYSQKENRTTNYCLLLLKMLYEENPKFLAEVLSTLVEERVEDHIGVKFRQQERQAASIPDGVILQKAMTVYIETKRYDWFYDQQLESHLEGLDRASPGLKVLIALGNFESVDSARFASVREICQRKYKDSVLFSAVGFEEFVDALRLEHLPKNLADAVFDLRTFLDEEDLLPSWKYLLDVVNCAGLPDDVLKGNVYMCPATAGAYSHQRCKYFGMYRNKRVERIAHIDAVVDVEAEDVGTLKWRNVDRPRKEFEETAVNKAGALRPEERPLRVFILGELYETDLIKDSSGGMQSSKQYFNIRQLNVNDARQLAEAVKGKRWSEIQ